MKNVSLAYCAARSGVVPSTIWQLRSQNRSISSRHCDLSDAGQTIKHLADVGLAGEQLGDADRLDRLAEAHVVGQDRAAGADGEGDAVELIRQELGAKQLAAQRMSPDRRGSRRPCADPLAEQPALDVLLGVGIDGHYRARAARAARARWTRSRTSDDRLAEQRRHDGARVVGTARPVR